MITVAEHSIDESLLTGGTVIDAGCRGFGFSVAMRDMGCRVLAFDIEDMVAPEGIEFKRAAILNRDGLVYYKEHHDKQATHLTDNGIPVEAIDINTLYKDTVVDVLKLDVEGSEYLILSDKNFQPVPRQISVEFHEHCHKDLHRKYFEKCVENMLRHYRVAKMERYEAHGAGFNYWDCLFINKVL